MKKFLIILILILFSSSFILAQETDPVPASLRENRFFQESLRLSNMARLAFAEGEYQASRQYSEEAIRYAELSDEYVRMRLRMMETDRAITTAGRRLDFAASINAHIRYPSEYSRAQAAFNEARAFRAQELWDDAIDAANRVLALLAYIDVGERLAAGINVSPLPAQYVVRTWEDYQDCLYNIAGRPWVYNDTEEWRRLFNANRDIMPDPNNPDLIHPGMVLNIPPIRGEVREGIWDTESLYPGL
ncbi:MAG: LysM peptidoglycan-binding domain-containing protein [Treponema sp.]|nr:LysM peptidoglycan-binding domain-containing protein [Treponema sp.]